MCWVLYWIQLLFFWYLPFFFTLIEVSSKLGFNCGRVCLCNFRSHWVLFQSLKHIEEDNNFYLISLWNCDCKLNGIFIHLWKAFFFLVRKTAQKHSFIWGFPVVDRCYGKLFSTLLLHNGTGKVLAVYSVQLHAGIISWQLFSPLY